MFLKLFDWLLFFLCVESRHHTIFVSEFPNQAHLHKLGGQIECLWLYDYSESDTAMQNYEHISYICAQQFGVVFLGMTKLLT